jgi:hypothetical protein
VLVIVLVAVITAALVLSVFMYFELRKQLQNKFAGRPERASAARIFISSTTTPREDPVQFPASRMLITNTRTEQDYAPEEPAAPKAPVKANDVRAASDEIFKAFLKYKNRPAAKAFLADMQKAGINLSNPDPATIALALSNPMVNMVFIKHATKPDFAALMREVSTDPQLLKSIGKVQAMGIKTIQSAVKPAAGTSSNAPARQENMPVINPDFMKE